VVGTERFEPVWISQPPYYGYSNEPVYYGLTQFLQLDNEIEVFAGQFMTSLRQVTSVPTPLGVNAGLSEQLDRIEQRDKPLLE
jgi:hypothetical protein